MVEGAARVPGAGGDETSLAASADAPEVDARIAGGADRLPLKAAYKQAFSAYRHSGMTDHAASLTYFAMMSIFPALLFGISLLGLVGAQSLAGNAADYVLKHGADHDTAVIVKSTLATMIKNANGAVGVALVISLVLALNGASGAFGAAGRALNEIYGVKDDRSWVDRKLNDIRWTAAVLALMILVVVAVFLGGGLAKDLFGTIGLGRTAGAVWNYVRWPVALLAAISAFSIIYTYAPDVAPRRIRFITPGTLTSVAIWILASFGFSIYIQGFSKYGAAYGAFGAAIILLLWLYLSANAFLFGAELNAVIARSYGAGRPGPPGPSEPPSVAEPGGRFRRARRGSA